MSSVLAIQPVLPQPLDDPRRTPMPVLAFLPSRRRADEVQFRVVYLLTFPVVLVSSLVGRLVSGRRPGHGGESLSVLREAQASAQTCGSFSLMG